MKLFHRRSPEAYVFSWRPDRHLQGGVLVILPGILLVITVWVIAGLSTFSSGYDGTTKVPGGVEAGSAFLQTRVEMAARQIRTLSSRAGTAWAFQLGAVRTFEIHFEELIEFASPSLGTGMAGLPDF